MRWGRGGRGAWGVGAGGSWGSAWRTVMDEVEGLKSSGSSLTPPPGSADNCADAPRKRVPPKHLENTERCTSAAVLGFG